MVLCSLQTFCSVLLFYKLQVDILYLVVSSFLSCSSEFSVSEKELRSERTNFDVQGSSPLQSCSQWNYLRREITVIGDCRSGTGGSCALVGRCTGRTHIQTDRRWRPVQERHSKESSSYNFMTSWG